MLLIHFQKRGAERRNFLLELVELFLLIADLAAGAGDDLVCLAVGVVDDGLCLVARFPDGSVPHFLRADEGGLDIVLLFAVLFDLGRELRNLVVVALHLRVEALDGVALFGGLLD